MINSYTGFLGISAHDTTKISQWTGFVPASRVWTPKLVRCSHHRFTPIPQTLSETVKQVVRDGYTHQFTCLHSANLATNVLEYLAKKTAYHEALEPWSIGYHKLSHTALFVFKSEDDSEEVKDQITSQYVTPSSVEHFVSNWVDWKLL